MSPMQVAYRCNCVTITYGGCFLRTIYVLKGVMLFKPVCHSWSVPFTWFVKGADLWWRSCLSLSKIWGMESDVPVLALV
jgi:hypothetical protein